MKTFLAEDVPLCLVKNPQEHHKVDASAPSTSEFVVTATKRSSSTHQSNKNELDDCVISTKFFFLQGSRRKSCVPRKRPKLQAEETTSIPSLTCLHLPTGLLLFASVLFDFKVFNLRPNF